MAEDSRRHALTEQFEELREAALREGPLRHGYRTARPVRAYLPSTAWKLSLPGFTNSLFFTSFQGGDSLALLSPNNKGVRYVTLVNSMLKPVSLYSQ